MQQTFLQEVAEKTQTDTPSATNYIAASNFSQNKNKVEIATLPGAPNQKGYISYWILDPVKTQEVINRMIYRDKPVLAEGMKFKAGIMYSPKREKDLKNGLSQNGVDNFNLYSRSIRFRVAVAQIR